MISKVIINSASSKFAQKAGKTLAPIVLTVTEIVIPAQAAELPSLKIPPRIERIATSPETAKHCPQKTNEIKSEIDQKKVIKEKTEREIAEINATIEKETKLLKELQAKPNLTDKDKQEIKKIIDLFDQDRKILEILDKQLLRSQKEIIALEEKLNEGCSPKDASRSL